MTADQSRAASGYRGCCHEKRKEKTTPFGVILTRSLVIYQAVHAPAMMPSSADVSLLFLGSC